MISVGDVAAFVVAAVTRAEARNHVLLLGGPDAVSWTDVVHLAERALDRGIDVEFVDPGEPLPGLPDLVADMAAGPVRNAQASECLIQA